ncbi:MAG: hypothetical protein GX375_02980 [Clostridiales bacterium]|nr:hypothetical protein [Clostridiales bacterium]
METGHMIKIFTKEGNQKLDKQYLGTRKAILQIAFEKTQEFMRVGDVGLGVDERKILESLIANSMTQSFSLGYGIGKVEGLTNRQVHL